MPDSALVPTHYGHWVAGRERPAGSGGRIARQNPATGAIVSTYAEGTADDASAAVTAARQAFDGGPWPRTSAAERAALLLRVAALIRRDKEELARIECVESGKPLRQARSEMEWAAGLWEYAAALARQLHGESYNTLGEQLLGFTLRDPAGVVALITPWNFPLLIISQKLPFALAAGCTCVVKPSEFTGGTTLRLGKLLDEAGLPPAVCNVVTGYGETVGRALSEHPHVDLVSFTGSTVVGKAIVAASHGTLKRVELELGGKNPQIVFGDADLDAALDAVVFGVAFNAGQCCNSGSRVLLHRDVPQDFVDRVVERMRTLRVGNPLDETTQVGAIVSEEQFDKIVGYLEAAPGQGARTLTGGRPLDLGAGRFVAPTVFDQVTPAMAIAREEIFGPVLSLLRFSTPEEAAAIANGTIYGLSASVWTRDLDRAVTLARSLRAGTVWVNTFMDGPAELPFGGYGQSGLGRELGRQAVETFTEVKSVQIHTGPRTAWWHPAAAH